MYVSNFENIHGETAVFIQHSDEPWPWIFHGDTLIHERPVVMKVPPAPGIMGLWTAGESTLLSQEEAQWAVLCWSASQHLRTRFLAQLRELAADDDLDENGRKILEELETRSA